MDDTVTSTGCSSLEFIEIHHSPYCDSEVFFYKTRVISAFALLMCSVTAITCRDSKVNERLLGETQFVTSTSELHV